MVLHHHLGMLIDEAKRLFHSIPNLLVTKTAEIRSDKIKGIFLNLETVFQR